MSSDKAPERIYVGAKAAVIPMNGVYTLTSREGDLTYIRDDGDLISRSTVVKRLREVADEARAGRGIVSDSPSAIDALADEFEAADKDLELK